MIYLLDLNFTLVANSREKRRPFSAQIEHERYREWLVELLRGECVLLMTARPDRYRGETLRSIEEKTKWKPTAAFFNTHDEPPPKAKQRILKAHVMPIYGKDNDYFAIESNPATRAMYRSFGIRSVAIKEGETWKELPTE